MTISPGLLFLLHSAFVQQANGEDPPPSRTHS